MTVPMFRTVCQLTGRHAAHLVHDLATVLTQPHQVSAPAPIPGAVDADTAVGPPPPPFGGPTATHRDSDADLLAEAAGFLRHCLPPLGWEAFHDRLIGELRDRAAQFAALEHME